MYQIFGIDNCDKCRRARGFFSERAQFYDIRKTPLSDETIEFFCSKLGELIINKRSKTWLSITAEDRKQDVVELLKRFPLLMKRPLIRYKSQVTVGWNEQLKECFDF